MQWAAHLNEQRFLEIDRGRGSIATAGVSPLTDASGLSILPCHAEHVCSFLRVRSRDTHPSHPGKQRGSFQSQFRRCAVRSTDDPAGLLKCFQNQSAIGIFQSHRRVECSSAMQTWDHELLLVFAKWVLEYTVPRQDHSAFHQVLQLTNVARPGIPLEGGHGFWRNRVNLLSHAVAKQLHEMRDKCRNVLTALSE